MFASVSSLAGSPARGLAVSEDAMLLAGLETRLTDEAVCEILFATATTPPESL
jgi:hypothetical protein